MPRCRRGMVTRSRARPGLQNQRPRRRRTPQRRSVPVQQTPHRCARCACPPGGRRWKRSWLLRGRPTTGPSAGSGRCGIRASPDNRRPAVRLCHWPAHSPPRRPRSFRHRCRRRANGIMGRAASWRARLENRGGTESGRHFRHRRPVRDMSRTVRPVLVKRRSSSPPPRHRLPNRCHGPWPSRSGGRVRRSPVARVRLQQFPTPSRPNGSQQRPSGVVM